MTNDEIHFVQTLRRANLTVQQLADGLSVSKPSIKRWLGGLNLPAPATRKAILKFLETSSNGQDAALSRQ